MGKVLIGSNLNQYRHYAKKRNAPPGGSAGRRAQFTTPRQSGQRVGRLSLQQREQLRDLVAHLAA
ncbi:hypothetical protein, partial [Burkholderia gladioli]|uniref:hypothetical protein n=1 Tax=Burkholderia gladioli TaxID=28095 RepID=UPI002445B3DE